MTTFWSNSNFNWVKIDLDSTVGRKGLDKINVYRVYNLYFFDNHKASCLWFMKHYQTKKKLKKIQSPFIKSLPLCYDSGFFLKEEMIMHVLVKKCNKTHFLNQISSKFF